MGLSTNYFPTETYFFLSNKQSETVSVLFNEMLHYLEIDFERQVSRVGEVLQPILPNKNVTFSVMMVEGVEWVCEQLSETQCKPLYPKVRLDRQSRYSSQFIFCCQQQSENKDGRQPSAESRVRDLNTTVRISRERVNKRAKNYHETRCDLVTFRTLGDPGPSI